MKEGFALDFRKLGKLNGSILVCEKSSGEPLNDFEEYHYKCVRRHMWNTEYTGRERLGTRRLLEEPVVNFFKKLLNSCFSTLLLSNGKMSKF